MRHKVVSRNFGRRPNQRKALMRGLATSLLEHGRIETTVVKAKELRRVVEPLITLGKSGTLHARRRAAAIVYKKSVVSKLFGEVAEQFKDRPGGYTRIYKLGHRRGDGAEMAMIELVKTTGSKAKGSKGSKKKAVKKVSAKKAAPAKKAKVAKKKTAKKSTKKSAKKS